MDIRKAVVENTIAQTITRLCTSLSTFIVSYIIAQSIGATGYGAYSMVVTYVAFYYLFADFGLNAIFIQRASEKRVLISKLFSVLFITRLIIAVILTVLSILLALLLPHTDQTQGYTPQIKSAIALFSLSIVLQALITSFQGYLQYTLQYSTASLATILGTVVTLIITFGLFMNGGSFSTPEFITYLLIAQLIGLVVTVVHIYFCLRKKVSLSLLLVTPKDVATHILSALPLAIVLLCNLVYFRVDSIIMGSWRTMTETGMYNFSYKIFELFLTFPTFFMNSLYPVLADSPGIVFVSLVKKSMNILLILSLLSTLLVLAGSPLLLHVFPQLPQSPFLLQVLSLGFPFFFLSSLTMWILIAQKKQLALLFIYIVSMIVNIISNALYIPAYGAIAAATITVLTEALVLLLSFVIIKKLHLLQK